MSRGRVTNNIEYTNIGILITDRAAHLFTKGNEKFTGIAVVCYVMVITVMTKWFPLLQRLLIERCCVDAFLLVSP